MLKNEVSKIRNSTNRLAQKGNEYFLQNPKKVIAGMAIIMVTSIAYLITKNILSPKTHGESIERIIESIPSKDSLKMLANPLIGNFMEVLELEKELKKLVQKDSLTKEDSLFILNLDNQLNNMMNEKD